MDKYDVARVRLYSTTKRKESPYIRFRFEDISTNVKSPFIDIYVTSFLASCTCEAVVYPLDVCKTRLQIQGEISSKTSNSRPYRGMLATAHGIIKEEGPLKLYGGVSAMILRHSIFTGLKMYIYDTMRDKLTIVDSNGKGKLTYSRCAICGIVAGAAANVVATPTDLIKVQMQMEGTRRLMGKPPRTHNIYQAFTSIYQVGGVMGLWKGTVPTACRAALVTLGDVSFYDLSKRKLMELLDWPDNRIIQFMAAMIAGFAGAVLSTPADVVKSRIMNQPTDEKGRGVHYKGTIDCFNKLIKKEGFFAMYKGFMPYWLRVGPWTLVFWMTFEQIRRFRGDQAY